MKTEISGTESCIDKRTRRACVESMTVHPHGSGSGMFDVYNVDGKRYVVDLRDGVCECPDHEHREPAGGCKHQRRCRLEFGLPPFEDVPEGVRTEHAPLTDVELARRRRGIGVEPEPEPEPITVDADTSKTGRTVATDGGRAKCVECGGYLPDEIEPGTGAYCPQCGHGQHITDGGAVVAPKPQGESAEGGCPHDHPDCEGADADTERPVLCFDCWEVWASQ